MLTTTAAATAAPFAFEDRLDPQLLRTQALLHAQAMQRFITTNMTHPRAQLLLQRAVGAFDPAAAGRLQDTALMLCGSPFPGDASEWRGNPDALDYLRLFFQEPHLHAH